MLAAPFIREKLPEISNWPTYPQLFSEERKAGKLHALGVKAKTAAELQASKTHLVQLQIP